MTVRFLDRDEYGKTKELAEVCFGSNADTDDYYNNDIRDNRVAVLEENGAFLSMVQLRRFLAVYEEHTVPAWYILYVCTAPEQRHKGYMDRVMRFVLQTLKSEGESFAFLVPVDPAIYYHLGFTKSWRFREEERELLYADDGLVECFACPFDAGEFTPPQKLLPTEPTA